MVTPGMLNRRAQLFEQLAAMISAGVPLTRAMELVARNRSTGIPQKTLQALTAHLQEGHTFTDAMQLVSGQKRVVSNGGLEVTLKPGRKAYALSEFDVALLSAGEESGRLDTTFKVLAHYYAARAKLIRDTIAGMIVTIVTLHVFLIIVPLGLFIMFVLGIINTDYRQCLPFIIEKIIVFGGLYALVWLSAFAGQGNRNQSWRAFLESVCSVVPLLGSAVKYLAVARLAMALDALLSAGVPVVRSWELSASACGSPRLKREIAKWIPELEHGVTPADMVAQIRYFPDMFVQLYQSGEMSGKTDEALAHLYTYFEDEGFRKLQAFCRIVMFLVYFLVAGLVGYYVISFYVGRMNDIMKNI